MALEESFGAGRSGAVGVWSALAALARYDLVLIGPIYAALLYVRGRRLRELRRFAPGWIAVGVVFITFNEIRYQSIFDRGLTIFANGTPLLGWKGVQSRCEEPLRAG